MEQHRIIRLGMRGDGIAEGPVFVPLTLPGELVQGRRAGDRLEEVKILTPSPDRVAPPCPHFKRCGGCQLQHASDAFVADWKLEVVRTALAAQGLATTLRPLMTSPAFSRRRATFAVRRTKAGAQAGFYARASDLVVENPGCTLLRPELLALRPVLEDLATTGASRKGVLAVTSTLSPAGADLSVSGGKPLDTPLRMALAGLAERHRLARLAWEDEVVAMRAAPIQRFGRAEVVPPPGAFLQATAEGEAALLGAVREITDGAGRIVDLFAGCGTFALPLAEAAEIHAVEGAAEMVAALDRGWRGAEGLRRVTSEARDLFRRPLLEGELSDYHAAVIDPPRAGAEAQVTELTRSGITRVAYVSCNPVTFARDAARLVAAGFSLGWVQVVDQFRWSGHVELVGRFDRGSEGRSAQR